MPYMTSRGKFKVKRSAIGADGMSVTKEFVQRKGESKASVLRRANTWQVEARGKQPSPTMKLGQAVDLYNEYRIGTRSDETLADDKYVGGIVKELLGSVGIDQLTPFHVETATGLYRSKKRTAKKIRDFGRKLYRWLAKRGWATSNPFAESDSVGYAPPKWEEPISAAHFEQAIQHVKNPKLRAIITLLRWTGIRPKSARELLWSEYDGRDIRKETAKTVAGTRAIFVPLPAKALIDALPRTGLLVFESPRTGGPFSERAVIHAWNEAQKKAGLMPRKLYDLKHLRVSEIRAVLNDDAATAYLLGLDSAETIRANYAQFDRASLLEKIGDRT